MQAVFQAIDLAEDWITRVDLYVDLRLCTGGSTWPVLAWLDARLFAGWRAREVNLVRRPAVESLVRAVLIGPVDDESHFVLAIRLVLGYRDQTQNLLDLQVALLL